MSHHEDNLILLHVLKTVIPEKVLKSNATCDELFKRLDLTMTLHYGQKVGLKGFVDCKVVWLRFTVRALIVFADLLKFAAHFCV